MIRRAIQSALLWLALAASAFASVTVEVGTFTADTGGVTTTVSTGCQGKAIILKTHTKTSEGESATALFSFGVADNSSHIGVLGWAGDDAAGTTNVGRSKYSNRALQVNSNGTPTQVARVTGVAFNSTPNFVLTWNTTPSTALKISYTLFCGDDIVNTFVGSTTLATSTGTQSIVGVGFRPDFVFAFMAPGVDATSAGVRFGMGAAVSASKQWGMSGVITDGQSSSAAVNGLSAVVDDAFFYMLAASGADDVRGDFIDFTSDGFDVNITNAAGASNQVTYLCIRGGQWNVAVTAKPTTATPQDFVSLFTPKGIVFAMTSATALDTATPECISTLGAYDGTNEAYAGGYHNDEINTVAKSAGASTKVLREIGYAAEADGTTLAPTSQITWTDAGLAYLVPWFAVGDTSVPEDDPKMTVSGEVDFEGEVVLE